jgi:hypothetical protein
MTALLPGWAERFGRELADADTEDARAKVTGLNPRKSWRENRDITRASQLRGAHKPGKRPLPEVEFPEDGE